MSVRSWRETYVTVVANQPYQHRLEVGGNAVFFLNRTAAALYVSKDAGVSSTGYEDAVPADMYGRVVRPGPIDSVWLLSAAGGRVLVLEASVSDITSLFGGFARGSIDLIDRAARAAGRVGLQVAGADVAAGNPVHVAPGTGATWSTEPAAGIAPEKVTGAGAGDVTVKAAAGRVFSIVASVAVELKNGAGVVFAVPANQAFSFPVPCEHDTSIVINFSAAGDAYIQYE